MAVTLRQLCENSRKLYKMQLLAGEAGLNNLVQWVHTLEDVETSEFLYGGELVFTTGISHKGTTWLLGFAKNLKGHGATGLVLNLGPYIDQIPQDLIDYCNRAVFPLFIVPWQTRLVDITREFCNHIFKSEKVEEDVGTTLKNLIFFPQDIDKYLPLLERHDFDKEANCCVIYIGYIDHDHESEELPAATRFQINRLLNGRSGWSGYFQIDKGYVYVLTGTSDKQLKDIVQELEGVNHLKEIDRHLAFGISSNRDGVGKLSINYKRSAQLFRLCRKQRQTSIFYDELDAQKVLLSVEEFSVLEEYAQMVLGKLIAYDREHQTDYLSVLKLYLEYDGSVKKVADQIYVHRNTVNYQLNKIKNILNLDFSKFEIKFQLAFAFKIFEIL